MKKRIWLMLGFFPLIFACNFGVVSPTPSVNLLATLAASTPRAENPAPASPTASPAAPFILDTPASPPTAAPVVSTSAITDSTPPVGKIVFTCQIFKTQAANQICLIHADGSGFRRLTTDDNRQHYYPSLAPDGKSVVYAAFTAPNVFDIYEMEIASGDVKKLTNNFGNLNAPEISPDGSLIIFKRWNTNLNMDVMYTMKRDGAEITRFSRLSGWDPTWSPDGTAVLFASNADGDVQLYSSLLNDKNLHRISDLPAIRGRSDWSPDGNSIVTYSGEAWHREVYIMNADGSGARILSPQGGNAQGPSFSPDGQWVTFTAYYDHYGEDHGCEIYILRVDGSDLRRLTNNDYCDYQPRWGN